MCGLPVCICTNTTDCTVNVRMCYNYSGVCAGTSMKTSRGMRMAQTSNVAGVGRVAVWSVVTSATTASARAASNATSDAPSWLLSWTQVCVFLPLLVAVYNWLEFMYVWCVFDWNLCMCGVCVLLCDYYLKWLCFVCWLLYYMKTANGVSDCCVKLYKLFQLYNLSNLCMYEVCLLVLL